MRKQIYICDHCKKEFDPKEGMTDLELDDLTFVSGVDLCINCYNEINKIVREFVGV